MFSVLAETGKNIGKNMIFWRKIVIFLTKYPKIFAPPSARGIFFYVHPPSLTGNPGSAPVQLYCNVYHVCSVIYYARYQNWVIRAVELGHLWLLDGYF